ncbi:MAG TPA: hypothetical protein VGD67_02070, partial [Pseudonocardiaceae bacterium]
MKRTRAEAVLARLDALPYPARMTGMARWARSAGAAERDDVLAELGRGDLYRRGLALHAAVVARHTPAVVALLGDPDPRLRARALSPACELAPDAVAAVLADAPVWLRRRWYRLMRRRGDHGLPDHMIDEVRGRYGDEEAAVLLTACSPATVARLLPEVGHALNRSALARRHPDLAVDDAERTLAALPEGRRATWWEWYCDGLLAAAPARPHRVLDVLERYAPADRLPGNLRRYGVLLAADP